MTGVRKSGACSGPSGLDSLGSKRIQLFRKSDAFSYVQKGVPFLGVQAERLLLDAQAGKFRNNIDELRKAIAKLGMNSGAATTQSPRA